MLSRAIRPVNSPYSRTRCLLISCLFRRKIASTENGLTESTLQQTPWTRPYTASENEIILQGRQQGLKWHVIAYQIGRSSDSARAHYRRNLKKHPNGPPPPRWSAIQEASVIQSQRDGESWSQVAARMGRSPKAVRSKYYKLVPRTSRRMRRDFSTVEDISLLHLRDTEHRSWRDIGRRLARDEVAVRARHIHIHQYRTSNDPGSDQAPRRFSKAEDTELLRLKDNECLIFRDVAHRLGRPYSSVRDRYALLKAGMGSRPTMGKGSEYSEAEDRRIRQLRDTGVKWKAIHAELPHRTRGGLRARYRYLTDRQQWAKRTG